MHRRGLRATGADGSITVTWTASTGTPAPTDYEVCVGENAEYGTHADLIDDVTGCGFRNTDGTPDAEITLVTVAGATTATAEVTGLDNDTLYRVAVRAIHGNGPSTWAEGGTVTPMSLRSADSSLATLTVAGTVNTDPIALSPDFDPALLRYTVTTTEAVVNVTATVNTNGGVLTGAWLGVRYGFAFAGQVGAVSDLTMVPLEIGSGSGNRFWIRVTAEDGTMSDYQIAFTRNATAPNAPTAVFIARTGIGEATAQWSTPVGGLTPEGYEVCLGDSTTYATAEAVGTACEGGTLTAVTVGASATSHAFTSVAPGDYRVAVRATHSGGNGPWAAGDPGTVEIPVPPGAVTGLTVTPGDNRIDITYTAPDTFHTASEYQLCLDPVADHTNYDDFLAACGNAALSNDDFTDRRTTAETTFTYTASHGATNNVAFHLAVRSVDPNAGNSGWEGTGTEPVTPMAPRVGDPTSVSATGGNNAITVEWTASMGEPAPNGYRICVLPPTESGSFADLCEGGFIEQLVDPAETKATLTSADLGSVTISNGMAYRVAVLAYHNAAENSPWVPITSGTVTPSPTDVTLMTLSISPGTLDSTFSPTQQTYTATVPHDAADIGVTATPTISGRAVTISIGSNMADQRGEITLNTGSVSTLTIVVSAIDSTTETYTVTITRLPAPPVGESVVAGILSLTANIAAPAADSTLPEGYDACAVVGTVVVAELVAACAADGANIISVAGSVRTILINRDAADNALVDARQYGVAARATHAVGNSAWVFVGSQTPRPLVVVSIDASLSDLTAHFGDSVNPSQSLTLNPAFDSYDQTGENHSFNVQEVTNDVTQVTVGFDTTDANATVTLSGGGTVLASSYTHTLDTAALSDSFGLLVTAEDTTTTKTFNFNLTRAIPPAPAAPQGSGGDAEISLTWSAPDGTPNPIDYDICVSTNAAVATAPNTYCTAGNTISHGGTTTTATIDSASFPSASFASIENDTAYYVVVRAVIVGDVRTEWSAASGAITPQEVIADTDATLATLSVYPGSDASGTALELTPAFGAANQSANPVTFDASVGSDVTSVHITYTLRNTGGVAVREGDSTNTDLNGAFTASLPRGDGDVQDVTFTVTPPAGATSSKDFTITITRTQLPLEPPTGVTAVGSDDNNREFTVGWFQPDVDDSRVPDGYEICVPLVSNNAAFTTACSADGVRHAVVGSGDGTQVITDALLTGNTLADGATYRVSVRSYIGDGGDREYSNWGTGVTATTRTLTPPSEPLTVTAEGGNTQITVNWQPPAVTPVTPTGYRTCVASTSSFSTQAAFLTACAARTTGTFYETAGASDRTVTVGVANGQDYHAAVQSTHTRDGNSDWAAATGTVRAAAPVILDDTTTISDLRLTVSGTDAPITLDPDPFSPNTLAYTANVLFDVSIVNLVPTRDNSSQTLTYVVDTAPSHDTAVSIPLVVGDNIVTITVTPERPGVTAGIYTVTINRAARVESTNPALSLITVTDSDSMEVDIGDFAAATLDYSVTVAHTITSVSIETTPVDSFALTPLITSDQDDDATLGGITLDYGVNVITVTGRAEVAGITRDYVITITRELPPSPGTPGSISVTPTDNALVVSWTAPTGETTPDGYEVCVVDAMLYTDADRTDRCIAGSVAATTELTLTTTATTFPGGADSGLTAPIANNQQYAVFVRSTHGIAEDSGWSAPQTATPIAAPKAADPTGVSISRGDAAVTVSFSHTTPSGHNDPQSFSVCVGATADYADAAALIAACDGDNTQMVFDKLIIDGASSVVFGASDGRRDNAAARITNGVEYNAVVRANTHAPTDSDNNPSEWEAAATPATPVLGATSAVLPPSDARANPQHNSLTVNWTAPGGAIRPEGYEVCVLPYAESRTDLDTACTADHVLPATGTLINVGGNTGATIPGISGGIVNGGEYNVAVRAKHASNGDSDWILATQNGSERIDVFSVFYALTSLEMYRGDSVDAMQTQSFSPGNLRNINRDDADQVLTATLGERVGQVTIAWAFDSSNVGAVSTTAERTGGAPNNANISGRITSPHTFELSGDSQDIELYIHAGEGVYTTVGDTPKKITFTVTRPAVVVPAAVTDLAATQGTNVLTTNLSWTPPTVGLGGDITDWRIRVSGGGKTTIATVPVASVTTATDGGVTYALASNFAGITDTVTTPDGESAGIVAGVTYTFSVAAVNSAGDADYSNAVEVTPTLQLTAYNIGIPSVIKGGIISGGGTTISGGTAPGVELAIPMLITFASDDPTVTLDDILTVADATDATMAQPNPALIIAADNGQSSSANFRLITKDTLAADATVTVGYDVDRLPAGIIAPTNENQRSSSIMVLEDDPNYTFATFQWYEGGSVTDGNQVPHVPHIDGLSQVAGQMYDMTVTVPFGTANATLEFALPANTSLTLGGAVQSGSSVSVNAGSTAVITARRGDATVFQEVTYNVTVEVAGQIPEVSIDTLQTEVLERAGAQLVFTVRSNIAIPTTGGVVVPVSVGGVGSFLGANTQMDVTIAMGATETTVEFGIINDSDLDTAATATASITTTNPALYTINPDAASATVMVTDNDDSTMLSALSWHAGGTTDTPALTIAPPYSDTVTDYTIAAPPSTTGETDATSVSLSFATVNADTSLETTGSVAVADGFTYMIMADVSPVLPITITAPDGSTRNMNFTFERGPVVTLGLAGTQSATVTEAEGPVSYTVTSSRNAPAGGLEVDVTLTGADDFVLGTERTQTATFAPGQNTADVNFPLADDEVDDTDATITATIVASPAYRGEDLPAASNTEVTVTDNDVVPSVATALTATQVAGTRTATLTWSADVGSSAATSWTVAITPASGITSSFVVASGAVTLTSASGTDTGPGTYSYTTPATLSGGSTVGTEEAITSLPIGEAITFTVAPVTPVGEAAASDAATATINLAPTDLTVSAATINEGDTLTITATLPVAPGADVILPLSISNPGAQDIFDNHAPTITIPADQITGDVTVTAQDTDQIEGDVTSTIDFLSGSLPTGIADPATSLATTVMVTNDDIRPGAPSVTVAQGEYDETLHQASGTIVRSFTIDLEWTLDDADTGGQDITDWEVVLTNTTDVDGSGDPENAYTFTPNTTDLVTTSGTDSTTYRLSVPSSFSSVASAGSGTGAYASSSGRTLAFNKNYSFSVAATNGTGQGAASVAQAVTLTMVPEFTFSGGAASATIAEGTAVQLNINLPVRPGGGTVTIPYTLSPAGVVEPRANFNSGTVVNAQVTIGGNASSTTAFLRSLDTPTNYGDQVVTIGLGSGASSGIVDSDPASTATLNITNDDELPGNLGNGSIGSMSLAGATLDPAFDPLTRRGYIFTVPNLRPTTLSVTPFFKNDFFNAATPGDYYYELYLNGNTNTAGNPTPQGAALAISPVISATSAATVTDLNNTVTELDFTPTQTDDYFVRIYRRASSTAASYQQRNYNFQVKRDTDISAAISIEPVAASYIENGGVPVEFVVTSDIPILSSPIDVSVTLSGAEAYFPEGTEFTKTATIAKNGTTATVSFGLMEDDQEQEARVTATATIQPGPYSLAVDNAHTTTVELVDDDLAVPQVSIEIEKDTYQEGVDDAVVVTLSASPPPRAPLDVTVSVNSAGNRFFAAADRTRIITFPAFSGVIADSTQTIRFPIDNDFLIDNAATDAAIVVMSGVGYVARGGQSEATFSITDNEIKPAAPSNVVAASGPGRGQITISWENPLLDEDGAPLPDENAQIVGYHICANTNAGQAQSATNCQPTGGFTGNVLNTPTSWNPQSAVVSGLTGVAACYELAIRVRTRMAGASRTSVYALANEGRSGGSCTFPGRNTSDTGGVDAIVQATPTDFTIPAADITDQAPNTVITIPKTGANTITFTGGRPITASTTMGFIRVGSTNHGATATGIVSGNNVKMRLTTPPCGETVDVTWRIGGLTKEFSVTSSACASDVALMDLAMFEVDADTSDDARKRDIDDTQSFTGGRIAYNLTLTDTTDDIVRRQSALLRATLPADSAATIMMSHVGETGAFEARPYTSGEVVQVTVAQGLNVYTFAVTPEDGGAPQNYRINLTRPPTLSADATLRSLTVSDLADEAYTLSADFAPATTEYTLSVPDNIESVNIAMQAGDQRAREDGATIVATTSNDDDTEFALTEGTGTEASMFTTGIVQLAAPDTEAGVTTFTFVVTSEDTVETATYTVTITRALPVNPTAFAFTDETGAEPGEVVEALHIPIAGVTAGGATTGGATTTPISVSEGEGNGLLIDGANPENLVTSGRVGDGTTVGVITVAPVCGTAKEVTVSAGTSVSTTWTVTSRDCFTTAALESLEITDGTDPQVPGANIPLTQPFSATLLDYVAGEADPLDDERTIVAESVTAITVAVMAADSGSISVENDRTGDIGGVSGGEITLPLRRGDNLFIFTVTAEDPDSDATATYTLSVHRNAPSFEALNLASLTLHHLTGDDDNPGIGADGNEFAYTPSLTEISAMTRDRIIEAEFIGEEPQIAVEFALTPEAIAAGARVLDEAGNPVTSPYRVDGADEYNFTLTIADTDFDRTAGTGRSRDLNFVITRRNQPRDDADIALTMLDIYHGSSATNEDNLIAVDIDGDGTFEEDGSTAELFGLGQQGGVTHAVDVDLPATAEQVTVSFQTTAQVFYLGARITSPMTFNRDELTGNTIALAVQAVGGGTTQTFNLNLRDEDQPTLTIAPTMDTFIEGDDDDIAFLLTADNSLPSRFSVPVELTGADAFVAEADRMQIAVFQSGDDTASVLFPLANDALSEPDATVTATIGLSDNDRIANDGDTENSATAEVLNDDVVLSIVNTRDNRYLEGGDKSGANRAAGATSEAVFEVTATPPPLAPLTVTVTLTGANDFVAVDDRTQEVIIPVPVVDPAIDPPLPLPATVVVDVVFPITDNNIADDDAVVVAELAETDTYQIDADAPSATAEIHDDEPIIGLVVTRNAVTGDIDPIVATEGSQDSIAINTFVAAAGSVLVDDDATIVSGNLPVEITLSGGGVERFVLEENRRQTATHVQSQGAQQVGFALIDDDLDEDDATVTVRIEENDPPTFHIVSGLGSVTLLIHDDDDNATTAGAITDVTAEVLITDDTATQQVDVEWDIVVLDPASSTGSTAGNPDDIRRAARTEPESDVVGYALYEAVDGGNLTLLASWPDLGPGETATHAGSGIEASCTAAGVCTATVPAVAVDTDRTYAVQTIKMVEDPADATQMVVETPEQTLTETGSVVLALNGEALPIPLNEVPPSGVTVAFADPETTITWTAPMGNEPESYEVCIQGTELATDGTCTGIRHIGALTQTGATTATVTTALTDLTYTHNSLGAGTFYVGVRGVYGAIGDVTLDGNGVPTYDTTATPVSEYTTATPISLYSAPAMVMASADPLISTTAITVEVDAPLIGTFVGVSLSPLAGSEGYEACLHTAAFNADDDCPGVIHAVTTGVNSITVEPNVYFVGVRAVYDDGSGGIAGRSDYELAPTPASLSTPYPPTDVVLTETDGRGLVISWTTPQVDEDEDRRLDLTGYQICIRPGSDFADGCDDAAADDDGVVAVTGIVTTANEMTLPATDPRIMELVAYLTDSASTETTYTASVQAVYNAPGDVPEGEEPASILSTLQDGAIEEAIIAVRAPSAVTVTPSPGQLVVSWTPDNSPNILTRAGYEICLHTEISGVVGSCDSGGATYGELFFLSDAQPNETSRTLDSVDLEFALEHFIEYAATATSYTLGVKALYGDNQRPSGYRLIGNPAEPATQMRPVRTMVSGATVTGSGDSVTVNWQHATANTLLPVTDYDVCVSLATARVNCTTAARDADDGAVIVSAAGGATSRTLSGADLDEFIPYLNIDAGANPDYRAFVRPRYVSANPNINPYEDPYEPASLGVASTLIINHQPEPTSVMFAELKPDEVEVSWSAPPQSAISHLRTGYEVCVYAGDAAADCPDTPVATDLYQR